MFGRQQRSHQQMQWSIEEDSSEYDQESASDSGESWEESDQETQGTFLSFTSQKLFIHHTEETL